MHYGSKYCGTALMATIAFAVLSMTAYQVEAASNTVILVVDDLVLPEIQSEVNRLQSDLSAEGYTAKIKSWTTATQGAQALRTYLQSEYTTAGQTLKGAILIGYLPIAYNMDTSEPTDLVYWDMTGSFGSVGYRQIWVSRMWALSFYETDPFFGSEVTLLKRTLQANHDYRTGASRLSHKSYFWSSAYPDPTDDIEGVSALQTIWPTAEVLSPDLGIVKGGEFMQEESHGHATDYDSVNMANIHELLAQVRYQISCSCSSGCLGGVVNNQILTRGGGNVLSIGASRTTYSHSIWITDDYGVEPSFRNKLASGSAWGDALTTYFPFYDTYRLFFYGDLSMHIKMTPPNQMPVVNSLTADRVTGNAPLTVNFSASASDPDGTIANYEWFADGHYYGKVNPTAAGASVTTTTRTYSLPHRYLARVEVADNYKARAWKEVEINVGPQPGQPLRVNCGTDLYNDIIYASSSYYRPDMDYTDPSGKLWLHDQSQGTGTWGWIDALTFYNYPAVSPTADVLETSNDEIYRTFRYDATRNGFTYEIPLPNGGYTLNLHFADMANTAPGQRLMDISVQGAPWLTAFDLVAAVGPRTATVKTTHVNVTGGVLRFVVKTNPNSPPGMTTTVAFLNAFEVLPDNSTPNQSPVIQSSPWANPNPVTLPATTSVNVVASDPDNGPSALTYTWSKVSGPGTVSFSPNGITGSAFSTASFSAAGTYVLRVTVYDGLASVTGDVTVTVNAAAIPPSITTQPASQTVTVGQTPTFSVVAVGAGPLSYQWTKNGVNIFGATGSSYTTLATTTADNGSLFSVVVSNPAGTVTSNNATLTVNSSGGSATIVLQDGLNGYSGTRDTYLYRGWPTTNLGSQSVMYVDDIDSILVRFAIFQAEGGPVPNGATIGSATLGLYKSYYYGYTGSPRRVLKNWTELQATWNNANSTTPWSTPGAVGSGTDVVSTPDGQGSVGWDPAWLLVDVTAGVKLFASGTANNGWYLSGVAGNAPSFYSREYATNPTLRPKLTIAYQTGPAVPPTVTTQPANQTVTAGQTATFSVLASGTAPLSYQWKKNGANISGATSSSYTTPATTTADNGSLFSVVVSNSAGTVPSNNATLTVNSSGGATTIVLQDGLNGYSGTRDTYMYKPWPTTVLGTQTTLSSDDADSILVRFAIFQSEGGPVPNGATIDSATLGLYKSYYYNYTSSPRRVLRNWIESETTWNNANASTPWSTPGAYGSGTDIAAAADGTGSIGWNPGWLTIDVSPGVQAFASGSPNNGWYLGGVVGNTINFCGREYSTDPTLRPKLTVTYHGGTSGSLAATTPAPALQSAVSAAQPLTISKLNGIANFAVAGRDLVSTQGSIPNFPASFTPSGQTIMLNVNGARASFKLDAKGHAKSARGSFALKSGQFTAKLLNGTWSGAWGMNPNASMSNSPLSLSTTIWIGDAIYTGTVSASCTSKAKVGAKIKK